MSGVQDLSGSVLRGYHLGDCLGWSSHTAVYRAVRGGSLWAVKVIDSQLEPDGSLARRLRRDALLLSDIGETQVLPIRDAGRSGKFTYAVNPLVHAETLQDLMSSGPLNDEQAWAILAGLADALDRVHSHGLVFRVLKPQHLMIVDSRVYLAEFGLASNRVGPLAMPSTTYDLSSPQYLAPEQIGGREPDWRADIYALAVLLFELLTHTSMRAAGPPSMTLRATLDGRVPSAHDINPNLPRDLDRVLRRAMAGDPGERHGSAWELLNDLVAASDQAAPPVVPARPRAPVMTPPAPGLAPAVPAALAHVSTAPTNPAPQVDSMVAMLKRMGMPILHAQHQVMLNSYLAALVRFAEEASGASWPAVLAMAGLESYLQHPPPDDGNRAAPIQAPSRLAYGIEAVFGPAAPGVLRRWGRLTSAFWIKRMQQLQDGDGAYRKPRRLVSRQRVKVGDTLYIFARNLDRIRGEQLTNWKQVDKRQFWLVLYDNLTALGRPRPAKSCYFWTAALEAALRSEGLANGWVVEEAECGCVTGTYDCVFTIQQVKL